MKNFFKKSLAILISFMLAFSILTFSAVSALAETYYAGDFAKLKSITANRGTLDTTGEPYTAYSYKEFERLYPHYKKTLEEIYTTDISKFMEYTSISRVRNITESFNTTYDFVLYEAYRLDPKNMPPVILSEMYNKTYAEFFEEAETVYGVNAYQYYCDRIQSIEDNNPGYIAANYPSGIPGNLLDLLVYDAIADGDIPNDGKTYASVDEFEAAKLKHLFNIDIQPGITTIAEMTVLQFNAVDNGFPKVNNMVERAFCFSKDSGGPIWHFEPDIEITDTYLEMTHKSLVGEGMEPNEDSFWFAYTGQSAKEPIILTLAFQNPETEVKGATCDGEDLDFTDNGDGTYTVTIPNTAGIYYIEIKAEYTGELPEDYDSEYTEEQLRAREFQILSLVKPNNEAKIESFKSNNIDGTIDQDKKEINITLPVGTDLKTLTYDAVLSWGAKIENAQNIDFSSETAVLKVIAEDGVTSAEYTVKITLVGKCLSSSSSSSSGSSSSSSGNSGSSSSKESNPKTAGPVPPYGLFILFLIASLGAILFTASKKYSFKKID